MPVERDGVAVGIDEGSGPVFGWWIGADPIDTWHVAKFLLRAGKSPFDHIPPAKVYWDDLIARNSGNLLFAHSAYKTLSAPGAEIDVTRYRNPDPGEADAINEKYDRFVIPLANAFRPDFESQLKSLTALITRLKIPCVVVGVGAQADIDASPERRGKLDASVKAFVSAVLDKSHSIGVRGEFTAAYLKALGFGAVTVIGCPSMFLHGEKIAVTKRVGQLDASARIAVNLTRGMPENIAPLYRAIFSDRADAVYVAQNRADLAMLLWGLGQGRTGKEDLLPADVAHPVVRSGRSRFFTDVPTWLDFLRARDFSFGTRIHGNVFAILAGTPAYVIAHDSRTLELARYFDIPHRRIEAVTENDHGRGIICRSRLSRASREPSAALRNLQAVSREQRHRSHLRSCWRGGCVRRAVGIDRPSRAGHLRRRRRSRGPSVEADGTGVGEFAKDVGTGGEVGRGNRESLNRRAGGGTGSQGPRGSASAEEAMVADLMRRRAARRHFAPS